MTRTKRHLIRRIALGFAIAAVVPAIAHARPVDMNGTDLRSLHAEALALSQYKLGPGEVPATDEGFPWPSSEQGMPPTVAEDTGGYDIAFGAVSSAVIILLLGIAGSVVAVRHVRKTRLAPA